MSQHLGPNSQRSYFRSRENLHHLGRITLRGHENGFLELTLKEWLPFSLHNHYETHQKMNGLEMMFVSKEQVVRFSEVFRMLNLIL